MNDGPVIRLDLAVLDCATVVGILRKFAAAARGTCMGATCEMIADNVDKQVMAALMDGLSDDEKRVAMDRLRLANETVATVLQFPRRG